MVLKRIFAATFSFFLAFSVFSKEYTKKIYLWDGIPGMETQKRDTVLYVCPPLEKKEKTSMDNPYFSQEQEEAIEKIADVTGLDDLPEIINDVTTGNIVEAVPFAEINDEGVFIDSNADAESLKHDDTQDSSAKSKRPAVIICPGGSYHHLDMLFEGYSTARWFASHGVHAFVLRYRVAYNCHHYPDQLEDVQMAIHYIRQHADEFNIDKNKIGAIGFSAGGHLVTMAGEFSSRDEISKLGINVTESLRPDFIMPIYPVVSMQDDIAHKWSRRSLLGHRWKSPDAVRGWSPLNFWGHAYSQELKDSFSMENPDNIPEDMPPVFILACNDDPVVLYENSVRLDKALSEKGVEHVFVHYPEGGHGFGMREKSKIIKETHWNDRDLLPWLEKIGVFEEKE